MQFKLSRKDDGSFGLEVDNATQRVIGITVDSPAYLAGLQVGDFIETVFLDDVYDGIDLRVPLSQLPLGDTIRLEVKRGKSLGSIGTSLSEISAEL